MMYGKKNIKKTNTNFIDTGKMKSDESIFKNS